MIPNQRTENSEVLDPKTEQLAFIAVLAATGMVNELPGSIKNARWYGASLEEVRSAIMVGLPVSDMTIIKPSLETVDTFNFD